MRALLFLLAAAVLGLTGGYAWSQWSKPSPAAAFREAGQVAAKPGQNSREIEESVYFASCADAKAAGKAPLMAGQPGYRPELDPGGSGLACPPDPAG